MIHQISLEPEALDDGELIEEIVRSRYGNVEIPENPALRPTDDEWLIKVAEINTTRRTLGSRKPDTFNGLGWFLTGGHLKECNNVLGRRRPV